MFYAPSAKIGIVKVVEVSYRAETPTYISIVFARRVPHWNRILCNVRYGESTRAPYSTPRRTKIFTDVSCKHVCSPRRSDVIRVVYSRTYTFSCFCSEKKKNKQKKNWNGEAFGSVPTYIYIGVYGTSSYVYIYMYIRLTHRSATSVRCSDLCLVRIPWQMARAEAGKRDKSSDNIRRVRRRRVYTVRIDCIHYIIRSSHSPLSSPSPVVPASLFARAGLASAGENLCLRMDIG